MANPTTGEENNQDAEVVLDEFDGAGSETPTGDVETDKGSDHEEPLDEFDDDPFEEKSEDDTKEEKSEEDVEPDAPKFDKDLDEWAKKTYNRDNLTDEDRATLQQVRNDQREFTRSRQAEKGIKELKSTTDEIAKEFEKEETDPVAPDNKLEAEVAELKKSNLEEKTLRLRSEFYQDNNISEETNSIMLKILKEEVEKAPTPELKLKALDHWSHPDQLPNLLKLAKAEEIIANKDIPADEATRKERERIAKLGKATGPTRNAKSTAPAEKKSELDELWDND